MTGLSKPIEAYPLARPEDLPPPPPPGAAGEPSPPASAAEASAEVAVLEFLDPDRLRRTLTLEHPFRLDGREVREVEVRALSVFQVGRLAGERAADLYPYFAAMTGLPAAVLRAMPADDGGRLIEICDPFLPRFLTEAASAET